MYYILLLYRKGPFKWNKAIDYEEYYNLITPEDDFIEKEYKFYIRKTALKSLTEATKQLIKVNLSTPILLYFQ